MFGIYAGAYKLYSNSLADPVHKMPMLVNLTKEKLVK